MPLTAALSRGAATTTAAPPTRRRPSGAPPPLPYDLRRSGWLWAGLAAAVISTWLVVFVTDLRPNADDLDFAILRWVADLRSGSLTRFLQNVQALGSDRTIVVLQVAVVAVALAFRRFRHVVVLAACSLTGIWMTTVVQVIVARPRPSAVEILGRWSGFSHPSRPVVGLSLTVVAAIYTLVPQGRWRIRRGPGAERRGVSPVTWVCFAVILLLCVAEIYLGVSHPTDVVMGGIMGVAIPLIAFRVFAPAEVFPISYRRQRTAHVDVSGRRGAAIRRAVREQLGLEADSVEPFALEGSWGSTPVLIRLADPDRPTLFGKIYTATHLRSDRWYKMGRTLLYGRLEDEATFPTVRRLVEYEDYLLRIMWAAGLPVPRTYGFLEITPEREYVIVNEFLAGAREIDDVDVEIDEAVIDDALRVVRGLWDAGLAHRDIKPANVLVRDRKVLLVDVAFAEVRPSPWRQAVDLANMMVVLALNCDPDVVYKRARLVFSDDELAEAFAAARGVTLPTQLRARLREDGRDVLGRLRALAPPRPPIRIQHWSVRRVGLTVAVVVGAVVALVGFVNAVRSLELW
jgi:membrane-associated phospholipid phosphatase